MDAMELCCCPECGLPAEVVTDAGATRRDVAGEMVGVRCVGRHWFLGLRERLVA
jgi:hypothetical protein